MGRICRPLTKVADKNVEKVRVPSGVTLRPGDVVLCETLDTTRADNIEVYTPGQVTSITGAIPCIVINQGFEQLADGRRPAGNPNPADYEFTAGQTVTVIRLENDLKFFISSESLDNTGTVAPAIGVKLILQANDYQLATANTGGTSTLVMNIEKVTSQPVGGQFGSGFEAGVITRVETGR